MKLSQSEHERINAGEYPGTRQLCVWCDSPTERCGDDSIFNTDGDGPLCEKCNHAYEHAKEKERWDKPTDAEKDAEIYRKQ